MGSLGHHCKSLHFRTTREIDYEQKVTFDSHIHLRQTETFEVVQGVLGVVKNGVEYAIGKEDGPVSVTPGVR